jgi:hypothetical protein
MGFITENDLTDGISGRVGRKIVYRTIKGITLATRRPKSPATVSFPQLVQNGLDQLKLINHHSLL